MSSPTRIKNSEFQAGGIYPGGTGIVTDIAYKLWDYNGNRPKDSEMCVEAVFTPTDGGNEGKPVIINWNVGPASVFMPDPANNGFALDVTGAGRKMSDSCTWHQMRHQGLINNCAMPEDSLDGQTGLKALIGSELTLVRMDPPKRDNLPQQQQQGQDGKPARVNQVLVATRAKFAWERSGKGRPATSAAASTGTTTSAPPASTNGSSKVLSSYIERLLTQEHGTVEMSTFTQKLIELLTLDGVKGKERVAITKQTKDAAFLKAIAAENNWGLDDLVIHEDGKMEGELYTQ